MPGDLGDESFRRWTTNRGDWVAAIEDGEVVLALPDNRTRDWHRGTVAIAGDANWRDYEFSFELLVLPPPEPDAGAWPGVVFRAQDTENYELVWLMPLGPEAKNNVVYLPVAHGLVPWWADAYVNNQRGSVPFGRGEWLPVSVRVRGLEASVRVRHQPDPVLTVRLSYGIECGRVGLYCGTRTSAKFRRMRIELLEATPLPDPPETAPPRFPGDVDA
ncbi:MAG: hypothetical protein HY723_05695 [Chloroflexi bacterium]|nr:hypothetical protein [Chloroflexota bacterium]